MSLDTTPFSGDQPGISESANEPSIVFPPKETLEETFEVSKLPRGNGFDELYGHIASSLGGAELSKEGVVLNLLLQVENTVEELIGKRRLSGGNDSLTAGMHMEGELSKIVETIINDAALAQLVKDQLIQTFRERSGLLHTKSENE